MGARTSLSLDATSAALNAEAHVSEHCALDQASLDVLGAAVGRQVLIARSAQRVALYTIVERLDGVGRAAHVGTAGLARLERPTREHSPGWPRCSAQARRAERSRTQSRSTARTTTVRSSWAGAGPGTRRTRP